MTGHSDLIARLRDQGVRVVALQFPAGLKRRAGETARELREAGFEVIISGDPCYGACDLAMAALDHADVLVHFGHTPIGEGHPRVIYEPFRVDFDVKVLARALPLLRAQVVGLVTTAQHLHLVEAMKIFLEEKGVRALTAPGGRGSAPGQVLGCSFSAARVPGVAEILFVGTGSFHPLGVQLATGLRVVALDPLVGQAREVSAEAFLRKRMGLIARAQDATVIGLLVSTKPGQDRFQRARDLAAASDRAFLVMMDEISPDELLNLGFGAYVNFACPRLAYDDQVRFPAPVLTPAEFEILLGLRDFEQYEVDELV